MIIAPNRFFLNYIMEAANGVINRINEGQLVLAKPVVRHGEEPLRNR